jgi:predicted acetyltransferase
VSSDASPLREDELADVAPIIAWSFALPVADCEPWLRKAGLENVRVLRKAGRVEAALLTIPMAQFFGGRSVPMIGVAGVAAPVETRGSGAAHALMVGMLREARARGAALSTLYPATIGLYRKSGYEVAGARYEAKVPVRDIGVRDHETPLRPMTEADAPAVEACYRARAARANGFVDRGAHVWDRVRRPRDVAWPRGFVVEVDGRIEGYAIVHERREPVSPPPVYALHATDLVALTPRAHRRLLAMAADHGTLGSDFHWSGAPNDPFVQLLPRRGVQIRLNFPWMLRLVDLPAALRARGWPRHVDVAIDLDVTDDALPENAGRWSLHVAAGRATVERGGRGAVKIDVRALAALYTCWLDPFAACTAGGLEGDDDDLAALAAAFAGPSPWMPDFF